MLMIDKITKMCEELGMVRDNMKLGDLSPDDFDIYIFEQTWGSTALGFGGIGGQAMTTANTYVLIPNNAEVDSECLVYFAGKFAYSAPYSEVFMGDVRANNMVSVRKRFKYYKEK